MDSPDTESRRACSSLTAPDGFDDVVLPHLDAAYRLARWLTSNDHDAEDAVQEASMRAFRYFHTFSGSCSRSWFLTIVRNTCRGWYRQTRSSAIDVFDEEQHSDRESAADPETLLLQADNIRLIQRAMNDLPEHSRRLITLRELEGLSYQELADTLRVPIGTVMSRLSRARQTVRRTLTPPPHVALNDASHGPGHGARRTRSRRRGARVT